LEVKVQEQSDDVKLQMIAQGYSRSKHLFPDVEDITASELMDRSKDEDFVILDVRNPAEQAVSMIKGAITSSEFEKNREQFNGATFVTYCTIGHRSGLYAKKLERQGQRVLNLAGSVLSWTHIGGEFEDENGPTKRVHVAGPNFNFVASGYEPVW
jgi:sodium/bile acid cotransporter 7